MKKRTYTASLLQGGANAFVQKEIKLPRQSEIIIDNVMIRSTDGTLWADAKGGECAISIKSGSAINMIDGATKFFTQWSSEFKGGKQILSDRKPFIAESLFAQYDTFGLAGASTLEMRIDILERE